MLMHVATCKPIQKQASAATANVSADPQYTEQPLKRQQSLMVDNDPLKEVGTLSFDKVHNKGTLHLVTTATKGIIFSKYKEKIRK